MVVRHFAHPVLTTSTSFGASWATSATIDSIDAPDCQFGLLRYSHGYSGGAGLAAWWELCLVLCHKIMHHHGKWF